jgi:beta-galactosidase
VESNADEVEVWLNNQSLGKQSVPKNGHALYTIKYAPGELRAVGYRGGKQIASETVATAGPARRVVLEADRSQLAAAANGDVACVSVRVVDAVGRTVPNAGNAISFSVSGPGKIIGVGNGDPSSHEQDQWLAERELLAAQNWRGRIVSAPINEPSSDSLDPIEKLGNWLAKPAKAGEQYELGATFALSKISPDATYTIFLPASGARESIWVNGHALARDLASAQHGPECVIPASALVAGENRIRILATPIVDGKNHISERSTNGSVLVQHAEPVWQRSVFNGLAQVLVQTEASAGKITLRATAEGLEPAALELQSVAHPAR